MAYGGRSSPYRILGQLISAIHYGLRVIHTRWPSGHHGVDGLRPITQLLSGYEEITTTNGYVA